jgi:hypothetical protein
MEEMLLGLCRQFCGWDLLCDAGALTRWGSGEAIIDLLRANYRHNLVWRPPLHIVARLHDSFRQYFIDNNLAIESVSVAELRAQISLTPQKGAKLPKIMWAMGGDDFIACKIVITARVVAVEVTSAVRHEGRLEWPLEWKG